MPLDPIIGGALIGGGLDLAGGLFATSKNIKLAEKQMRFQERMASTQYQRAADDLEAAGLNRVLALGSPASAPQGARPNIISPTAGMASSAKNVGLLKSQANVLNEQARVAAQNVRTQQAVENRTDAEYVRTTLDSESRTIANARAAMELKFLQDNPNALPFIMMSSPVSAGLSSAGSLLRSMKSALPLKKILGK